MAPRSASVEAIVSAISWYPAALGCTASDFFCRLGQDIGDQFRNKRNPHVIGYHFIDLLTAQEYPRCGHTEHEYFYTPVLRHADHGPQIGLQFGNWPLA